MNNNNANKFEYLPWETGSGFMWGFPATIWLLLLRPHKAFSLKPFHTINNEKLYIPPQNAFNIQDCMNIGDRYVWYELYRPMLFLVLFMTIYTLGVACFQWGRFILFEDGMAQMQKAIDASGISLFKWNAYRLGVMLVMGPLKEGVIIISSAIIASLLGVILRIENIDMVLVARILMYAVVSNLLLLVPVVGGVLMAIYILVFIAIGVAKSHNAGWLVAIIISVTATAAMLYIRFLVRPLFEVMDNETIMYLIS